MHTSRMPGSADPVAYPPTRRGGEVDDFHGSSVADPYRWLEELGSPQVAQWIHAQNALTEKVLSSSPWRPALRERLSRLQQFERRIPAACTNGTLFYWRHTGEQPQPALYAEPVAGGAARLVLDPGGLSADGTMAVADLAVSPNGRWLAYAVSTGGSDALQWRVRCLQSLKDRPDSVVDGRYSGAAWLRDSSGFVYGCYPDSATGRHAARVHHELRLHRLGEAPRADVLVYRRVDRPHEIYAPHISACGHWLVVRTWDGSARHRVHRVDLRDPAFVARPLLDDGDASYVWVGCTPDGEWLFLTDALGGQGAVIGVDPERPQRIHWRTVVPPGSERLETAVLSGGHVVLCSLQDGASRMHRVPVEGGRAEPLPLPGLGTAHAFVADEVPAAAGGCAGTLYFGFMSFTVAPALMRLSPDAAEAVCCFDPRPPFDGDRYETVLEWADSADGTRVPLHVTRLRGSVRDGNSPCLLIGYGGFGLSQRPGFVASRIAWLEMGGVLVQAMVRGGGEYGQAWHDAARLRHKPRTFEDFMAVAEHLIRAGYTRPARLVAHGGSNGGLTATASVLQRPDLFGALVAAVPILDMLRYHHFGIGAAWAADYGRSDREADFATLMCYSPLHNVRAGHGYPPMLLLTGERDDRVHPAHAFKFAAEMQHRASQGDGPVLLRVETRAGHGAGKPADVDAAEKADLYTFIAIALGLSIAPGRWP